MTPAQQAAVARLTAWLDGASFTAAQFREDVRELLAAVEASGKGGWQSIASAPENEDILVLILGATQQHGKKVWSARKNKISNGHMWVVEGQFGFDVGKPTAWQPLPAPPQTEG